MASISINAHISAPLKADAFRGSQTASVLLRLDDGQQLTIFTKDHAYASRLADAINAASQGPAPAMFVRPGAFMEAAE